MELRIGFNRTTGGRSYFAYIPPTYRQKVFGDSVDSLWEAITEVIQGLKEEAEIKAILAAMHQPVSSYVNGIADARRVVLSITSDDIKGGKLYQYGASSTPITADAFFFYSSVGLRP